MKKPNSAAGLNLWNVDIEYQAGTIPFDKQPFIKFASLWITTRNASIKQAMAKTESFLKRNSEKYVHARINAITHSGTIDA